MFLLLADKFTSSDIATYILDHEKSYIYILKCHVISQFDKEYRRHYLKDDDQRVQFNHSYLNW